MSIIEPVIVINATDEMAKMLITANKYGVTCTLPDEMWKFTVAIACVGIIIGIMCTLVFQYTRRKARERIEQAELEEKIRENNSEEGKR